MPRHQRETLPPPSRGSVHTVCPSQISATDEIMLDFIPSDYIQATPASTARPSLPPTPSGELPRHPPPLVLTPPPCVRADAVSNVASYRVHVTGGSAAAAASRKPVAHHFHAAAPRAASSAHAANINALRTGYERVRGCRASPATTRGRPGKKLSREGDGKVAIGIAKN